LCAAKLSAAMKLRIEPPKLVDLIISKQTQYYTLWAVYTAVQFTAGSYGNNQRLSVGIALAVFFGVWAFNLGHLGFVLQCVAQLNRLSIALNAAFRGDEEETYDIAVRDAFENIEEGTLFWRLLGKNTHLRSYRVNTFVHLFIDTCASVALLIRIGWIQDRLPQFLQLPVMAH
jgi:hypothetical protein